MNIKNINLATFLGALGLFTLLNSCSNNPQKAGAKEIQKTIYYFVWVQKYPQASDLRV